MDAEAARYDVIIVGGGQAGLALGYHLTRQGRRFSILDAGEVPAAAWRSRWDSLTLFTSARDFELPVELNSHVRAVKAHDRGYLVTTDSRSYETDQVVIATGPFQTPRVPSIAQNLVAQVHQIHSGDYRRPGDVPTGPVLVVGGGNTGFQIAYELAATHEVHLWATGFGLVDAPVFGGDGAVLHTRGVTAAPGLYVLGLPWQYTRGSALLGFVNDDAQHIADQISKRARVRVAVPGSPTTADRHGIAQPTRSTHDEDSSTQPPDGAVV